MRARSTTLLRLGVASIFVLLIAGVVITNSQFFRSLSDLPSQSLLGQVGGAAKGWCCTDDTTHTCKLQTRADCVRKPFQPGESKGDELACIYHLCKKPGYWCSETDGIKPEQIALLGADTEDKSCKATNLMTYEKFKNAKDAKLNITFYYDKNVDCQTSKDAKCAPVGYCCRVQAPGEPDTKCKDPLVTKASCEEIDPKWLVDNAKFPFTVNIKSFKLGLLPDAREDVVINRRAGIDVAERKKAEETLSNIVKFLKAPPPNGLNLIEGGGKDFDVNRVEGEINSIFFRGLTYANFQRALLQVLPDLKGNWIKAEPPGFDLALKQCKALDQATCKAPVVETKGYCCIKPATATDLKNGIACDSKEVAQSKCVFNKDLIATTVNNDAKKTIANLTIKDDTGKVVNGEKITDRTKIVTITFDLLPNTSFANLKDFIKKATKDDALVGKLKEVDREKKYTLEANGEQYQLILHGMIGEFKSFIDVAVVKAEQQCRDFCGPVVAAGQCCVPAPQGGAAQCIDASPADCTKNNGYIVDGFVAKGGQKCADICGKQWFCIYDISQTGKGVAKACATQPLGYPFYDVAKKDMPLCMEQGKLKEGEDYKIITPKEWTDYRGTTLDANDKAVGVVFLPSPYCFENPQAKSDLEAYGTIAALPADGTRFFPSLQACSQVCTPGAGFTIARPGGGPSNGAQAGFPFGGFSPIGNPGGAGGLNSGGAPGISNLGGGGAGGGLPAGPGAGTIAGKPGAGAGGKNGGGAGTSGATGGVTGGGGLGGPEKPGTVAGGGSGGGNAAAGGNGGLSGVTGGVNGGGGVPLGASGGRNAGGSGGADAGASGGPSGVTGGINGGASGGPGNSGGVGSPGNSGGIGSPGGIGGEDTGGTGSTGGIGGISSATNGTNGGIGRIGGISSGTNGNEGGIGRIGGISSGTNGTNGGIGRIGGISSGTNGNDGGIGRIGGISSGNNGTNGQIGGISFGQDGGIGRIGGISSGTRSSEGRIGGQNGIGGLNGGTPGNTGGIGTISTIAGTNGGIGGSSSSGQPPGGPCDDPIDCQCNNCTDDGVCQPCDATHQCPAGQTCSNGTCLFPPGTPCTSNSQCQSNYCDPTTHTCGPNPTQPCGEGNDCRTQYCNNNLCTNCPSGNCTSSNGGTISTFSGTNGTNGQNGTISTISGTNGTNSTNGTLGGTNGTNGQNGTISTISGTNGTNGTMSTISGTNGTNGQNGAISTISGTNGGTGGGGGQPPGAPCTSDNQCTSGQCDVATQACAPNRYVCRDGTDCRSSVCTQRTCTACSSSNDCPQNGQCVSGYCQVPPGGPCKAGLQCSTNYCQDNKCTACTANNQCGAGGECVSGSCKAPPGTACNFNSQCTSNKCENGFCAYEPGRVPDGGRCIENADCKSSVCRNNICVPCSSSKDCPLNGQCLSGKCKVPNNGPCKDDAQCLSNRCRGNICLPCNSNSECSYGGACINQQCKFPAGAPCWDNTQCESNACVNNFCAAVGPRPVQRPGSNGPLTCGNGVVDPGEQCDDGSRNSDFEPDACRADCTSPRCGDGIIDSGEQCDDRNGLAGDGCDRFCRLENSSLDLANLGALGGALNGSLTPIATSRPPAGKTGPAAIGVMAAGAAWGWAVMRRRRRK